MLDRLALIPHFLVMEVGISCQATERQDLLSSEREVGPPGGLDLDSHPPIDAYKEGKCQVAKGWTHTLLLDE